MSPLSLCPRLRPRCPPPCEGPRSKVRTLPGPTLPGPTLPSPTAERAGRRRAEGSGLEVDRGFAHVTCRGQTTDVGGSWTWAVRGRGWLVDQQEPRLTVLSPQLQKLRLHVPHLQGQARAVQDTGEDGVPSPPGAGEPGGLVPGDTQGSACHAGTAARKRPVWPRFDQQGGCSKRRVPRPGFLRGRGTLDSGATAGEKGLWCRGGAGGRVWGSGEPRGRPGGAASRVLSSSGFSESSAHFFLYIVFCFL